MARNDDKGRWRRRLGWAALVVAVLFVFALLPVAAGPRDVTEIAIPAGSSIARTLPRAHYADAYRAEIPRGVEMTIEDFYAVAVEKPPIVFRDSTEVHGTARMSFLDYDVSYLILSFGERRAAVMATTARFHDWKGRLYFYVVRPVHRIVLPWLTSWMMKKALAAREPGRLDD